MRKVAFSLDISDGIVAPVVTNASSSKRFGDMVLAAPVLVLLFISSLDWNSTKTFDTIALLLMQSRIVSTVVIIL